MFANTWVTDAWSHAPLSVWGIVLAFTAWSGPGLAQVPPTVKAPVLQDQSEVPYPAGGQGDVLVVLELVVEKDGTVSHVEVVDGPEPFASQAKRTVPSWRFTPALRGDAPIAARIRASIAFHQEPHSASDAANASPDGTMAPIPLAVPTTESAPESPLDVTVRGRRQEIGEVTLSAADVREMPGAFGDAFRAIEALPGVTPVVSGLPYFYIRGAPPNDNGYDVDGVRVPLLFHVGVGEAVIHPGLIDHVDFFPSAPPASYGGTAGAVIAGQTREPAPRPHGEANLRLFDAGALVETPFASERGSVLVAGRYGYPGPIVGAITPTVKLGYWDYQARGTWRLGDRDTLVVFAFGSHDYLGTVSTTNGEASGPVVEQLGSDFHRLDLRYDRALAGGHLRVATTLGYDEQGGAAGGDNAAPATIRDRSAAARIELDERLSSVLRLRAGLHAHYDRYDFTQALPTADQVPVPSSADPPPTNITGGLYADVVWHQGARVQIVAGGRVDVFQSSRSPAPAGTATRTTVPAFDPRLSARVLVTPKLAWLASFGITHQYPSLRIGPVPGLLLTVPGFPFGDGQLQTAVQVSQGFEVSLPAETSLTANGFFSRWSGLTDLSGRCLQIMPPTTGPQDQPTAPEPYTCPDDQPVSGYAYGGELLLRRSLSKRLAGWISYTLSRSRRDAHFATLSGDPVSANVLSDYDRTHVVNAVLAYALGHQWRAGARGVFYSGAPYSDLSGNVPVPPYNGHRGPSFFRLDIRVEKRWLLANGRSVALVLEGQNVSLSRETSPAAMRCVGTMSPQGGTNQCKEGTIGPLTIPSIGVEAFF